MESILLTDRQSGSQARVAAHLGFNCHEFVALVDGVAVVVIDAADDFAAGHERPSGHGIPILFPFPNRIRDGRFKWNGREYALPESRVGYDRTGNAIHGFCLDRPWRIIDQGERHVTGAFRLSIDAPDRLELWPGDCAIEIRYELRGAVLRAVIRISNPGDAAIPWGFGTHPYFRLPLAAESDTARCLVQAPAGEEWELVDCLPTGVRRPIGEGRDLREGEYFDVLKLDDVLTGLEAQQRNVIECVIMDEQAGLEVLQRFDTSFRELVVYTPPGRNAVCLEPYTCVTDAINLQSRGVDAGLRTLGPGCEFQTIIEIEARRVMA